MSNSRWANASREELEALAHASEGASTSGDWSDWHAQMTRLRASCPPLRAEAEVAAEALAKIRRLLADDAEHWDTASLRALAKEQTRD